MTRAFKSHIGSRLTLVLVLGAVTACQGGSILDRKAPFGSKVVRFGDVEVATVDGTAIYLSDVEQAARIKGQIADNATLDPSSPIFHKNLRQLIDQRVLGLAAITQSLDQSEEAKRRLARAKEQLYGRFMIENVLASEVTDEDVRRLYDEQKSLNAQGEERRVRHIVVETREDAETVETRLENGEDFVTLAGILSLDEASINNGGDLGFFSRGMLGQEISDVSRLSKFSRNPKLERSDRLCVKTSTPSTISKAPNTLFTIANVFADFVIQACA